MVERRKTKTVSIGNVKIGSSYPVLIQSMTKTNTTDIDATVKQIHQLEKAGCEIIRVAVKDQKAAKAIFSIKQSITVPLVADIHFDYKLAIEAIKQGASKIRINPGNIGSIEKVREVITEAKKASIPVRIGINAGSLKTEEKTVSLADNMVRKAMQYVRNFEDWGLRDIVISLKASSVTDVIEAYRKISAKTDYPLHIGVTESGPPGIGTIKSAVAAGILLNEGYLSFFIFPHLSAIPLISFI